ncbi:MAG: hypothetical protein GY720_01650 [bacterium]|nr:hypothetical protein [bacterium]
MPLDRENMVVGVDYIVSMQAEGKVRRNANLEANLPNYQLYQALLQGGSAILAPPSGTRHPITGTELEDGSYIQRLPGESRTAEFNGHVYDEFALRVKQSAHVPIAEEIISIYVNTLFRQMIDRSAITQELGDAYMADVDLRGHSAEDFLAYVYTMGLALGWVAVLTDMPRTNPGDIASKAHEDAAGNRPYSRVLSPTRIWQWQLDPVTDEFITILIHESYNRWRHWDRERWVLIDENAKIVDEGAHDFDRVPVDLFIAREPTQEEAHPPLGVSAINSSALLQLMVDNHQSLGDELQRKTNFPLLHVQVDSEQIDEAKSEEVVGAGWMLFYDAEVNWKSPSPDTLIQNRAHIADLEGKIHKAQGVHRRSQDSVEAHSGLALDYESSPIYATVQAWSRRLRSFENRFWQTVGSMLGKDVPPDVVSYPEDFSVRPVDLEIKQASGIVEVYGGFAQCPGPVKSYIDVKIAAAMLRDKGHLAVVRELVDALGDEQYAAEPQPETEVIDVERDAPDEAETVEADAPREDDD